VGDRFVYFDIETDKPAGEAGISPTCAATLTGRGELRTWHGPAAGDGLPYPRTMPEPVVSKLVRYLYELDRTGWTVVGWNSLRFDFRVLAMTLSDPLERGMAKRLAMGHVDPCFASVCRKGFPVSLAAAAAAQNLQGKLSGIDGMLAIQMWTLGTRDDQETVLDYVRQDVKATMNVVEGMRRTGVFGWVTRAGRYKSWRLPNGTVPDVESCLRMKEVDVSWMSDPTQWSRDKFTAWLEE
jgi:hypothetical protein